MADQTTGHHSAFLERVQQAQGHYNEQAGLDKSLTRPVSGWVCCSITAGRRRLLR